MFTVQKATVDEVPEIKAVLKATWVDAYGKYYPQKTIDEITSVWHSIENLTNQVQNPDIYFAVAKDETGKIVGITDVRKIDNETLMLDRMYILPSWQGKGIGKLLMHAALTSFPGINTVFLEVESQNKNAIGFYEKQGFISSGETLEKIHDITIPVTKMKKVLAI